MKRILGFEHLSSVLLRRGAGHLLSRSPTCICVAFESLSERELYLVSPLGVLYPGNKWANSRTRLGSRQLGCRYVERRARTPPKRPASQIQIKQREHRRNACSEEERDGWVAARPKQWRHEVQSSTSEGGTNSTRTPSIQRCCQC